MKAMLLSTPGRIEDEPLTLAELPDPEPGEKEIRIRVSYCGVCRTDLHVVEGDLKPKHPRMIPGHQIVGRVDRLGPGCTRFRLGQSVGGAWLRASCGHCEFCGSDRENLCLTPLFNGYDSNGGFAELCVLPEDFAYAIPGDEPSIAPLLCAGIIGFRAYRRANVPERGRLGLFGFGSSAHLLIQLAKAEGKEIAVVSRDEKHVALARELGADWAGTDVTAFPGGLDSAILFAPAGELVPVALAALKRGGTLVNAGIYCTDIPVLNYEKYLFYERDLRSATANTRRDGHDFLALAEKFKVKPRVQVYDLAEANRALLDLKQDRIRGSGVLRIAAR